MKWTHFQLVANKTLMSAFFAVWLIPIIADQLYKYGLRYEYLRVPILGGVLYLICYAFFKYLCPPLINTFHDSKTYMDWARENNINVFTELKHVPLLSEKRVKQLLGSQAAVFYPLESGLNYSRVECIRKYSAIEYFLSNTSNSFTRYFLTILLLLSILMVNWLSIERLLRVLGFNYV